MEGVGLLAQDTSIWPSMDQEASKTEQPVQSRRKGISKMERTGLGLVGYISSSENSPWVSLKSRNSQRMMKQVVCAANRKIGLQVVFSPATRIIGQSHFPYLIHVHRVRKAAQSSFSFQPFSSSSPAQQGSPYTPVSRASLKPSPSRIHALDEVGLARAGSVDRGGSGDVRLAGRAGHGVLDTTEQGSQPSNGDLR